MALEDLKYIIENEDLTRENFDEKTKRIKSNPSQLRTAQIINSYLSKAEEMDLPYPFTSYDFLDEIAQNSMKVSPQETDAGSREYFDRLSLNSVKYALDGLLNIGEADKNDTLRGDKDLLVAISRHAGFNTQRAFKQFLALEAIVAERQIGGIVTPSRIRKIVESKHGVHKALKIMTDFAQIEGITDASFESLTKNLISAEQDEQMAAEQSDMDESAVPITISAALGQKLSPDEQESLLTAASRLDAQYELLNTLDERKKDVSESVALEEAEAEILEHLEERERIEALQDALEEKYGIDIEYQNKRFSLADEPITISAALGQILSPEEQESIQSTASRMDELAIRILHQDERMRTVPESDRNELTAAEALEFRESTKRHDDLLRALEQRHKIKIRYLGRRFSLEDEQMAASMDDKDVAMLNVPEVMDMLKQDDYFVDSIDLYESFDRLESRATEILNAIDEIEQSLGKDGFRMPLSSKKAILRTYLRNKNREISLDNIVPRPLLDNAVDQKTAERWISSLPTQVSPFAEYMLKGIRHVDQAAFEFKLEKAMEEFLATIGDESFAVLNLNAEKSNDWVYELAREKGLPEPSHVVGMLEDKTKLKQMIEEGKIKHVVIFDDASYSGSGLADLFHNLVKPIGMKGYDLHIVIPFMSKKAKENFVRNKKIIFGDVNLHIFQQKTIGTVGERLQQGFRSGELSPESIARFYDHFETHLGKIDQFALTYFQHKIADYESVWHILFNGEIGSTREYDTQTNIQFIPETKEPYKEDYISWVKQRVSDEDAATMGKARQEVGGIDLNPAMINLKIKRNGKGVPMPVPVLPIENIRLDGLLPVIIHITPILNLPLQLGLEEEEESFILGRLNS